MAQNWVYDDDEGLWTREDGGWTYNPVEAEFKQNDNPIELSQVPQAVRDSLEAAAQGLINEILANGQQQQLDNPVQITNRFDQGEITDCVVLDNTTFGSDGAAPCLIVFATGTNGQGQQVAVGAHLDNEVYTGPDTTVETMIEHLGQVEGDVAFYVFGGEVGQNTNPGGESTMDYSRYYPFFLAIEEHATIGRYNFPSNANETSTGAALSQDAVNVWHDN